MRRFGRSRICASLLALWVPLVVGLTGIVPRCAAHLGGGGHQASPAAEAGHHDHGGREAPSDTSHSCSCIGGCTVSRNDVVTPPSPYALAVVGFESADLTVAEEFPVELNDRGGDHYATGPPVPAA